jgi:geranylgeranyl diphosphate synthase type 3
MSSESTAGKREECPLDGVAVSSSAEELDGKTKAESCANGKEAPKRSTTSEESSTTTLLPKIHTDALLERIKKLCHKWAEEEQLLGNKVFWWNIMSTQQMRAVANHVPTTLDELADCMLAHNVQMKMQYGERLIQNINAYIEQEMLQQYVQNRVQQPKRKKKQKKITMEENTSSSSSLSTTTSAHHHSVDNVLLEPYHYISSIPGKDIRTTLIDCFNTQWLRVPSSESDDSSSSSSNNNNNNNNDNNNNDILSKIKLIVSQLHDASLLIDDIEDDSTLRRGVPVSHAIFGIAPTINAANYIYFLALEQCLALKNESAMRVFVTEMLNLHRGQGYDIYWRDSNVCPTEIQYTNMVIDKTGGLFRLAVGLLQAFATTMNGTVDYTPLVNNLGLYFQIRDDLLNLVDEDYMKGKSFCEDLTEGKFSYPIIHCIRSGSGSGSDVGTIERIGKDATTTQSVTTTTTTTTTTTNASVQLLSILKRRTNDIDVKKYARQLMIDAGSLRYAREKCIRLRDEIALQIQELGGNDPLLAVLKKLHVQIDNIKLDEI